MGQAEMAEYAELLSVEVLKDLRVALVRFAEDTKLALQDVDFDIRRTREWLSNEQRLYWQSEIRRWQQKLSQAKSELHRKKLSRFMDRQPDTSQEEKAVKRAEFRLENAQRKLERVKRWIPELQHAVQEYHTQSQPLADLLEMQLVRDLARLDRMIEAIELYTRMSTPKPEGPASSAGAASSSESMGRGDAPATGFEFNPSEPEKDATKPTDDDQTPQKPGRTSSSEAKTHEWKLGLE